ncbi:MAG: hypothetical protein ALECFALPRED_006919 [Alectoria fallacina]|uniref:Vacuolar calcium ion transporter n=1 Tax=Alectoria fallacina TaxID=1903189 RepID=A0A8H3EQK8_9LECA|nr:MAG: hypothetical protein ALECFALPRED_006919 [Alectoria fallacina]
METPAASGIKSKFRNHGRPANSRINSMRSGRSVPRENGNSSGGMISTIHEHINEQTSLLAGQFTNSNGVPLWEDNERPFIKWPAYFGRKVQQTLTSNYVNVFLVFVPLGIVSGAVGWSPTATFILNFLAIIPLASLLSFATEELSAKLGQTLGGLLNATFGNAVELIVSIVALKNDEIRIVQSSMLGSILSNILLVLGCCFFAGGIKFSQQKFNDVVASTMSSLMVVSTASLIIPATLYAVMKGTDADQDNNILILSHGTAVILLLLYVLYLFFQLRTHSKLFDAEGEGEENGEQEEGRVLSPTAAGVALVLITVLVAVCAEYLVDSIDSIVQTAHISKTFIGLVLLPIVGNAAEHVTAVVVALKDKMDLAIGVAIGSSMQIALLVTPFLVILGWIMDKPMTLHFETFETVVFFLSVLITSYVIAVSLPSSLKPLFQRKLTIVQDGKSNYLEGAMLLGMYTIIALAFYVYPDDTSAAGLNLLSLLPGGS